MKRSPFGRNLLLHPYLIEFPTGRSSSSRIAWDAPETGERESLVAPLFHRADHPRRSAALPRPAQNCEDPDSLACSHWLVFILH